MLSLLPLLSLVAPAQQTSPSVPSVPGEAPAVPLASIPDLNQAPPIAIASIVMLVEFGVYPLDEDLAAHPNIATTEKDLSFMLINLFAPGITGEYPVDSETAFVQLRVLSGGLVSPSGEAVVTGETFLPLLYSVVSLPPEEEAELRARLIAALPAWQIGNFAAPLTRAATAILLATAVDFLNERQAAR